MDEELERCGVFDDDIGSGEIAEKGRAEGSRGLASNLPESFGDDQCSDHC